MGGKLGLRSGRWDGLAYLATHDADGEEVGVGGECFGVDTTSILEEDQSDLTGICRAHNKL